MHTQTEGDGIAIGAVARIVGVPVETLRTWERRYGLPTPARANGGRRLYSNGEVELLRSVVQLAHRGERVRDLARLDAGALAERLALHRGATPQPTSLPSRLRVALIHPTLGEQLAGSTPGGHSRLDVVAAGPSLADLPAELELDAILIHGEALASPILLDEIEARYDVETVVVLASFLPRPRRAALTARGVRVVDEATPLDALRQRVEDAVFADNLAAGARPAIVEGEAARFTRQQLERVLNSPNRVRCECPVHLASLTLRLREFERYSEQCLNESPDDAAMHRDLAEGASEAAAILEALLERLCAREGITL